MTIDFRARQRGAVLLTSLVMLVVMTLLGLASLRISTVNLRAVNNMQLRQDERSAIQRAIESTLSADVSTNMAAATVALTLNAEKSVSVSVTKCLKSVRYISNSEIQAQCTKLGAQPNDTTYQYCSCLGNPSTTSESRPVTDAEITDADGDLISGVRSLGTSSTSSATASLTDSSRCGRVLFSVNGAVSDVFSGASTSVTQGVSILKSANRIGQLRTAGPICTS